MSKILEEMLQTLATEEARLLLQDIKDPEKRTPQFYQAVHRVLERNKFTISKVQPETSVLQGLADTLPDLDEDEEYGAHGLQ